MTSPGLPRALQGAIVAVDFLSLRPMDVIPFQYNPHTLTRTFELKTGVQGVEAGQLGGAPAETIKIEIELDAADDLDQGKGANGVAHHLAALESLVSPSSAAIIANLVLLNIGTIEIVPPTTKLTLFIFGPKRVLPVVINELSITEERHDVDLTAIVARASLGLRVLNWDDVGQTHPAFGLALAHRMRTEVMAGLAQGHAFDNITGTGSLAL